MRSNTSQDFQPGQSRDQRQNDPEDSSQQRQRRGVGGSSGSTLEWVIASAGALAILSLIAFFVLQAMEQDKPSPVNVVIQHRAAVPVESGYLVPVQLTNLGTQTAHGLEIEGELIDSNGNTIETSETSLDYLPPRSKKGGGLFFTVDPGQHQLRLRPKGYAIP